MAIVIMLLVGGCLRAMCPAEEQPSYRCKQIGVSHGKNAGNDIFGSAAFGNTRFKMKPILPAIAMISITIQSDIDCVKRQWNGSIRAFTDMSPRESIQPIGGWRARGSRYWRVGVKQRRALSDAIR
jgi:hypothetical protein